MNPSANSYWTTYGIAMLSPLGSDCGRFSFFHHTGGIHVHTDVIHALLNRLRMAGLSESPVPVLAPMQNPHDKTDLA